MRSRRTAAVVVLAAAVGLGGGCNIYRPGGTGYSVDTHTYISESHLPVNVTLVDTRTGESLWTYEVPVGRQLTLRFYDRSATSKDAVLPDLMRWEEMAPKTTSGQLRNTMNVPPSSARRLDVTYRPEPEMPAQAGG